MNFNTLLKSRTSVKEFSSKKPKEEHIIDIIEAGNLAPSPGNLPILNYTIVEDREAITKIAEACQQDFIEQAQVVIVVCSDQKKVKIMYDKRADTYTKQQAGAAIQNMLLKITELKLSSTWVGAFSEVTIKNTLKIPDEIDVETILPIGYAIKGPKPKKRPKPPLETRVFFDKYKNKEKVKTRKIGSH
jgi:nitroreductase